MVLPRNAKVDAAPNFLSNLSAAHQFFLIQDADTAAARFAKLKADLKEMIAVLEWSPAGARPARFLSAKSAQGKIKADAVIRLAEQAGLPHLREYVLGQNIVLFAHSAHDVVLLALKHQRQLIYSVEP